jgi:hypothetical protein
MNLNPLIDSLKTVEALLAEGDTRRAMHRLRGRIPGLRYVIAGDGPQRNRLEARAAELGLREQVRFTGIGLVAAIFAIASLPFSSESDTK